MRETESLDRAVRRAERIESSAVSVAFLLIGGGVYWFTGIGGILIYAGILSFGIAVTFRAARGKMNG